MGNADFYTINRSVDLVVLVLEVALGRRVVMGALGFTSLDGGDGRGGVNGVE